MGTRTVAVLIAWLSLVSVASADPASPPIEEAIKQAALARKPLLLEFHAQWCQPCKEFEAKTLPDTRVQAALKDVVFVRYDADDDVGSRAAMKYKVDAYPTFLVLDQQGVEVIRRSGAPLGEHGIKSFVELIEQAKREALDELEIRARLKEKPRDHATQQIAAQWFARRDRTAEAIALYEAMSVDKSATAQHRAVATSALVRLRRIKQWRQQLLAEKAALVRGSPESASNEDLILATVGSNLPPAEAATLVGRVLQAEADNDRLNSLVYIALAANAKDEALAGAKRVVEGRRSAQFLDTLAECYHVRGNRVEARRLIKEALQLAKGSSLERALLANSSRFDSGTGDSNEVIQYRQRAEDLWKRFDSVDKLQDTAAAAPAPADTSASMRETLNKMRKQMTAEHDLAVRAARACHKQADGAELAVARIELDQHGTITASVLLLEPKATPALRDCLTKEIVGAKLGIDPMRPKSRLSINFDHVH